MPGILKDTASRSTGHRQPHLAMHILTETLDDALLALYPRLLTQDVVIEGTRDPFREVVGILIEIARPRARLSRTETRGKPFSALGELLWYLTRDNRLDFIRPYIPRYARESEDGLTVRGGYGPRLFRQRSHDQVANVIKLLRARPTTKRAIIQIFDAEDTAGDYVEVPCTTTFQFLVRGGLLHMIVTMRSNDAFMGLPHDVFCFTMLQEIVARSLGRDVGTYRQFTGSMHLYERNRDAAQEYLTEGLQARTEMAPMPLEDPWPALKAMLTAEARIAADESLDAGLEMENPYWADLVRLLQIFHASGDEPRIATLKGAMTDRRYFPYIDSRRAMKPPRQRAQTTDQPDAGNGR